MAPEPTVSLPRWVLGLLVGACAACLVAVAFLLGRVTAPAPPATASGVAAPFPAGESVPGEAPAHPTGAPSPAALPAEPPRAGEAAPLPGPSPVPEAPVVGDADAAAVAAYFGQMDEAGAAARAGQDPQALARSVLDQTLAGNMDGIDGLIATQRALEARMKQVAPPPSCREHHQRSLGLVGRAIGLLVRTRDAVGSQDVSGLASVATEGRAIEEEARATDALANELRRAAGLPRVP